MSNFFTLKVSIKTYLSLKIFFCFGLLLGLRQFLCFWRLLISLTRFLWCFLNVFFFFNHKRVENEFLGGKKHEPCFSGHQNGWSQEKLNDMLSIFSERNWGV
jgi:hypothetical protein